MLFLLHLWGLSEPRQDRGYRIRMIASHLSCAFRTHFVGTTTAIAALTAQANIATVTAPALLAPYAALVACVRLRKEGR